MKESAVSKDLVHANGCCILARAEGIAFVFVYT